MARGATNANWKLQPTPSQALPVWQAVQDELIRKLAPFGADAGARDCARVLRLVGSVNGKNSQVVRGRVLSPQAWTLHELALRSALLLAQMAIIPIGASNLDAAAITDLLEVVELSRDYNPDLDVRVLLTRVDPRTKDAAEMLEFLQEQKLKVLPTKVCERVAFRRAIGEGAVVQELGKDQAAIAEMEAFFREVQNEG